MTVRFDIRDVIAGVVTVAGLLVALYLFLGVLPVLLFGHK